MWRTCPNCYREYETDLERPPYDDRPIQEIYPNAEPYQREQIISGLCSDQCWEEYTREGIETERP